MHNKIFNNLKIACLQVALSASMSVFGGTSSYYRVGRGSYTGKRQYLADPGLVPFSNVNFLQLNKSSGAKGGMDDEVDVDFHFEKGQKIKELLIVDGAVQNKSVFLSQDRPGVDIIEIESGKSGIVQLLATLTKYRDLEAVHVVSHAKSGKLQLGNDIIEARTFEENVSALAALNTAIKPGGDLLFYGCELAKGAEGQRFLEVIKGDADFDIAASNDPTGNAADKADWDLEIQTGDIEATPLPESIALKDFTGELQFSGTIGFDQIQTTGSFGGAATINAEFYTSAGNEYLLVADGNVASTGAYTMVGVLASTNPVGVFTSTTETTLRLNFSNNETFDATSLVISNYSGASRDFEFTSDGALSMVTAVTVGDVAKSTVTFTGNNTGITYIDIKATGGVAFYAHVAAFVVANVTAPASNNAPVLSGTATMSNVTEDDANPSGNTVASILADGGITLTDADGGALEGLAVTGTTTTNGTWEFSTNTGSSWTSFGSVSDASAVLLSDAATNLIRFVPNANYNGTSGNLTFRAWDQTSGTSGSTGVDVSTNGGSEPYSSGTATASLTVDAVNDAPTLTGTATMSNVTEDDANPSGNTVASILADGSITLGDVDAGALEGLAVTGTTTTNGTWEYSTNTGSSWTSFGSVSDASAVLLSDAATNLIRFVPNANYNGTSGNLTFRAWDQSTGSSGATGVDVSTNGTTTAISSGTATASLTVDAVNDAPTLTGTATMSNVTEDDADPAGNTVASILADGSITLGDVDAGALEGLAVTGTTTTNGTWEYSTNTGSSWTSFGSVSDASAVLLSDAATNLIRFVPNANYEGTSGNLTFRAWDQSTGSSGATGVDVSTNGTTTAFSTGTATASLTVDAVNDAPTLSGTATMSDVTEDDANPSGNTVASILADGSITTGDVDASALAGIAVTATTTTNGTWEYSTNTGSSWTSFGSVSDASAVLLSDAATNLIRFVPNASYTGTSGNVTFRAWDQTSGSSGSTGVDVSTNGTTTAFSSGTATVSLDVVAAPNNAPVLSGTATMSNVTEDDADPAGNTVASILADGSITLTDADGGALEGVAVTGTTTTNGTWEYSTNTGSSWTSFGSVSDASAVLLSDAATNLIRFVPNANYEGTSGNLTFRAWDQTSGSSGATGVDVSTNGTTTAFSAGTATASLTVDAVNDAPTITGTATMSNVTEDDADPAGNTVASILADGSITLGDVDASALEGLAVTGTTTTNGAWEFSTNTGSSWTSFGSVSDASAVLLSDAATNLIRFVPNANYEGSSGNLTFRAWDQTTGSSGATGVDVSTNGTTTAFSTGTATASLTVDAVNDAPTLTGTATMSNVTEDDADPAGNTVASILADGGITLGDIDASAQEGLAVTGTTTTNGTWEFSTNTGSSWTSFGSVSDASAVLLSDAATNLIRFVPNANYNGTSGNLTFRAWDQSTGSSGATGVDVSTNGTTTAFSTGTATASLTVDAANDAPTLTGTATMSNVTEDDANPSGNTVASILADGGITLADVDAGALEGLAVTGTNTANGTWEFSTNTGSSWTSFGSVSDASAVLLSDAATNLIRFVPNADHEGNSGNLTFRAWDQSTGSSGATGVDLSTNGTTTAFSSGTATASLTVDGVNDAPTLTGTATMSNVTEDDANPSGNTVASILADGSITLGDVDAGALEGLAVTGTTTTNGTWEFSTNTGSSWTSFGSVSDASAVLLSDAATNLIRFVPNSNYNGTSGNLTFRGWDQTSGSSGATGVDVSTNGTTTAFSTGTATASLTVDAANDAPTLSGTATMSNVTEDDTNPSGNTVASILADGGITLADIDAGAQEGLAVTGTTTTNGTWEFSTNTGSSWTSFGSVSDASAVLLSDAATNLIRFVPNANYNGSSGNLTFRAWDQSTGSSGATGVDVSTNGTTTAFSTGTATASLTVDAVNDAPVVTNSGGATSFTEGDGLTTIDVSITVTDVDHTTLPASATATVSITGGFQTGEDVLAFTNSNATLFGDAAASYNSGTGVLSITTSGGTTITQLQDVLRATQYNNTSNDPNTTARTITFQVNDGTDPSNSDTKTVNIFELNTAPTFTVTAVSPLNYSEGFGAVTLWQSATGVANAIEAAQELVAVSIEVTNTTDGSAAGDAEVLNVDGTDITLDNGNAGSISAGTVTTASGETITYNVSRSGNDATVALTGFSFTEAEFEDLIEGITYENTDGAPTIANRVATINFLKDSGLHDGSFDVGESNPNQTSTVTFIAKDTDSNLARLAGGEQTSEIDYTAFQGADGDPLAISGSPNVVSVLDIRITDSGTDVLPTIPTSITVDVLNGDQGEIRAIGIFDGTTLVGTFGSGGITSSNAISISGTQANSGGQLDLTVAVSFQSTVTDNNQFEFDISAVTVASSGSSTFAGGTVNATSTTNAGDNTIGVTASKVVITSFPTDASTGVNFSATVEARDANENVDVDYAEDLTVSIQSKSPPSPSGTLTGTDSNGGLAGIQDAPSSGVYSWTDLQLDRGADYTLNFITSNDGFSVTSGTVTVSDNSSDIVEDVAFDYLENIDYFSYQTSDEPTILFSGTNSLQVAQFIIRDGGASAESDAKVTRITDISFDLNANAQAVVAEAALFTSSGTQLGAEVAVGSTITFTGFTLDVADAMTATIVLKVTFIAAPTISDGAEMVFDVNTITDDTGGGRSGLVTNTPAGVTTSNPNAGDNEIDVIGTELNISANDPSSSTFERVTGSINPTIQATDANGNLDTDEISGIRITGTGSPDFDGAGATSVTATLSGGQVSPSFEIHNELSAITLTIADDGGPMTSTTATSVTIEDTTAPSIANVATDLSPFNTETNVALTGPLTMTFNEDVAVGSGDISIVLDVLPPEVITLDVTNNSQVSVTNNVATLTLPSLLKGSGNYYVIVDAGAFNDSPNNTNAVGAAELDFAGFTADTDWTFTTMADATPPTLTISRNAPASGTADATNSNTVVFALEFSEEIDPATFTEQDIAITLTGTTIGAVGTSQTADLYVANANDTELANSGDDINFTFTINNIAGDGTIGIEVGPNINDQAGSPNAMAGSVTSADFTIDNSASGFDAITITSNYSDNTLANTGNVITLVIDFDEDQGEAPTVDFASGGDVVNAGTVTATETNAGTFEWTATYTVDALDTDGAITYDINFTDVAGNAGSADETNGAVSGAVTVDRGAPVIERLEIVSDNATNNQYGITGNTITIEVEFNEDLNAAPAFTNVQSGGAAINDGSPSITETNAANDIWQYTYVVNAGDTDGNVTFDLNFTDAAGNAGAAASETGITNSSSMTIDNTTPNAPTVTIASDNSTNNLHATTGNVVTITLDFDEDMDAVSVDALQSGGLNTTNSAVVTETDAAQDIWTATYTVDAGDTEGNVTFSITFDDAAGNPEGAAITEADLAGSSVEVDLTAPTLQALSIASNNGTDASHAVATNVVTLTMDFDDDLSANPSVSFTSNGGAINNGVTVMETDAVNDIWTATYTVSALDNDGQVNFTLNFSDDAGLAGATANNTNLTGGGASQTVEIDNTAPTIEAMTISSDNGTNNQYGITGNTVTIQVDFDDDLSASPVFSNVQSGGVAINDASPSVTETNAANDIWEFTYVVNAGDTDGALTFDLNFTDDAGTPGTAASETDVTNSSSMTIDNLQPTVVVTDNHQDPDDANDDTFKQGDVVTITATFTEVNGLNGTPNIVIGTSVSSTGMSATADALVWTYDWTVPAGDDPSEVVSISVTDVAGNAIGTQTNTNAGDYEIDNTAPNAGATVHIESNNAVSTAGASVGDDVILTFTASETLAGDPTVVFQSDNANVQNAPGYTNTGGNNWEARYEVDAADQSGAISFTLDFTDVAGNAATQVTATGDASSVTVDSNVPSINSITITPTLGNTSNTGDNTAVFTIEFSEGVGNFTVADDIVINQTGLTLSTPSLNPGAGNTWILDFGAAGVLGNGTLSIDVLNNGASPIIDASGNTLPGAAGVEASSVTVTFDQTVPALSPVSLSTNNSTDNQHATAGDIVTLSFTSNDALSTTPTVSMAINGTAVVGTVTVNDLGSNMYTATYTIDGTGTVVGTDIDDQGALTFTIDFTDDAGNAGTQVTSTTDATSVEVDFTVPTLTTVTLISDNGTNNQHAAGGNTILLDIVSSDVLSALPDVVLRSGGLNVVGSVTVAHDNPGAPDFQNFNVTYTVDGTGSTGGVDKDADGSLTFFIDFEDDAGNVGTQVTSTTNASVMEVDVTAPTLNPVTVTTNNGTNNQRAVAGDVITFSFTSDDDLSATPVVNMSINGTAVVGAINVNTGSAPVYTATYTVDGTGSVVGTDIDDQGALTFNIAFTDDAGNAGTPVTATTNSSAVDVDFTVPTLTSVSLSTNNGTDNQHATTGDEITLAFTADDALSATPTVGMSIGGTGVTPTVNDLGSNNYSATYTLLGSENEGAVTFTIDFVDDAGNSGTQVTATTDATSVEADFNAPTLTTVSIASSQTASETFVNASHAADGNTVTLDITSSDVLSALPTVTMRSGNIDVQGPVTVAHDNPGAPDFQNFNVTYAVDGVGTSDGVDRDADGTVTFFINFVDDAGIAGTQVTATTDASTVEVDNTAPTLSPVTVTTNNGTNNQRATAGDIITFSFTADDDLSATPVVNMSINGTAVVGAINVNTGSAPVYTATYTVDGTGSVVGTDIDDQGALTFSIGFTDDAGNAGTPVTATTNSSAVDVDFTVPTLTSVSLSTNNGTDNQHAADGDVITLSFTADDDLATTPGVALTINGTAVVGAVTVNDLGSNNYSATYTADGTGSVVGTDIDDQGALAFSITFTDDAGNAGVVVAATTDATSVEVDFDAPTLTTVTLASSQTASETFVNASHAADGNTVTLDITSSDVLSALPTVTMRSGNIDVQGPVTVAHDNPGAPDFQNFNVTYAVDGVGTSDGVDRDADGTVTFFINFVDDAGNAGTQVTATTDASTVEVDNTAPTLSPVTVTTNNGTNNQRAASGDIITFSFTADDDLSATPVVNMSINGTAVVGAISVNTGSAPVYTATYTVDGTGSVVGTDIDDQGALTFSIAFTDDAGNAGTPVTATTNSSAVDVDFTAPTLTSVSLSTNSSTDNQHAADGDVITLSFTADDDLATTPGVALTINGTPVVGAVTVNDLGSNNYSATYTADGTGSVVGTDIDDQGALAFSITFTDDAGNAGVAVAATTDATSVEVDFDAPTLTTVTLASSQTASETFVNASHAADGNTVTLDITSSDVLSALPTVTMRSGNIDVQGPVTVAHDNPGAPDFQNFNVTYAVDGVGTSDGVDRDADGTVTFFINFVDDAGNAGTQVTATTNASTVEVDNTAPTLSNVTLVSSQTASEDFADASHGTTGNLVTLSFTADDDLSATPVIGLSIGGTAVTATVNTGSAPNYTATYTLLGTENNGAVTFTIDFTDDAGNAGTQVTATTDASSIEADFIAPTLSTVSLSTNNSTDNQHATTGDVITLSFTMDDDRSSTASPNPSVTMSIGGTGVTPTVNDLGSNNYSATYTLLGSENEGAVTFTIDFIDDAGISGTQVTATTDATSVEADFNAPTLTTVTLLSNNTTDNQHAKDGDVVTLDIVSSDVLSALPTVTIRSGNIDVQGPVTVAHDNPGAPDFQNFNVTYTVDGVGTSDGVDKDADGALTFFINFVDDAGIAGTQVTATTNASSIEVDTSDPVVESISIARTSGTDNTSDSNDFVKGGDQVTITVDFNDDLASGFPTISNLQSGGVAMVAAGSETITETDPTNEIWTIVFTVDAGDTDGSISFDIGYNDDAGNTGTVATQANLSGSSATVDNTAPTTTISAEIGSGNTEIIVTFNENVATNGTNPTDFTVTDEDSNNFAVSSQADGTAEDAKITLTVADFSNAEGDLLVTYTNNNGEIFDLANNAAPTTSTATIERTFNGEVSLTEIATGTGGDTNSEVAMYRTTAAGVNIFSGTPVTFTPSVEGSTITIYRDQALTDPVTGAQQTAVTKATGWTPTIDVFLADEGLTLGGTNSADYNSEANDINGVYTFYITETAVNGTDSEGGSVVYSLAFLDNIDNTNDRINFSVGETATTDLRVGNALSQELQITGVAIGTPTTAAGTSFVNSEATNITSATFNASIVGQGTYLLDFEWINATSDVSARFEDVVTLSITPVVSPFFESSQKVNFSRSETAQDLLVNSNPTGVDVATDTDGGDADFYDLEVYYVQNGSILTTIGSAGVNSSSGGEISTALVYSGTAQTFGSPSGASSTDWDIDPSAIDAFLDANVTSGRSVIDTLVIAYITANDNATSSTDLTVNTTTNLYLFEPVDDIVTQETDFATEYFTCEGDEIAAIATSNVAEEATYIWYTDDGDLTFDAGDTEITRSTTLTNANILNETTTFTAIDGSGQTTQTYTNDDGVNGVNGIYYFWVHHVRGATDDFLGTTSSATLIAITVFDDATEPVFNSNTAVAANNTNNVDFTLFYDAADLTESVTFSAASGGNFSGATFNPSASSSDVADAASISNEFRWYTSNENGTRGTQITSGATVNAQQLQLTGLTADADRYIYLEEVTNIVFAADGTTELYEGCTSNGVVILFSVKAKPSAPTGTTSFFYCEGETVADLTMNGEAGNTLRWLDVNNNLLFEQTTNTDGAFTAGIATDLGIGSTPADSLYTIKVFQVSDIVSTSTNSSSIAPDSVNIPFAGAISDTTVITIDVKQVPAAPVLDTPVNGVQYCDDVSTQLSIGFTDDGNADVFRIYQGDGITRDDDLSATQSAILFDLSEEDYLAGLDSTIFISQVSFSGEGGAEFAGCESPLARVDVHPNPEFTSFANGSSLINIVEACEVGITAEISIDNLNTLTEENFTVNWRIDDELRSESNNFGIEVDQVYNAGSSISLDISVQNQTTMCSADISETRIIGVTPIADFTINNITENNNTALVVRDNNPDVTNTLVESIAMTITDDNGNTVFEEVRPGGEDSGILNSEFNSDFAAGSYSATMLTISTSGCMDDQALSFNILPQVTISADTLIDFDRGNLESWFAEEDRNVSGELDDQNVRQLVGNSWDLDTPAGIQIFEDPDRNPESIMWITNRSGEYNAREVSYVYSPSFNIAIPRPAVSFDYYLDMANNDGVVLQYSTNDGDTWNTLGEPSTGIGWYNETGVPSNPGGVEGNPQRYAWSGDGGIDWLNATHAISGDDLTTIRFRFALGSRDAETKDGAEGFAFDNFRVFSRDRTTLLETFTSTQIWDEVDSTNAMKSTVYVKENFPGDIVVINYFTNLGDDEDNNRIDPIYDQNPSDPNARLAFYGINEIETGVLGGIEVGTDFVPAQGEPDFDANTGNLGFVEGDYSQDLLKPTSVEMDLSASLQENANIVDISLTVNTNFPEGLNPFDAESQISTRVMVLQESVGGEGLIENVPGDVVFQNVLREVITGSSGITSQGVIENNTQFVDFTESWEVSGIFANQEVDSVTMIVVAFVQDELSREILQVVERTVRVAVPETVTSIHPDFFSSRESYDIYPNPAENVFTVELEKPTMMDLNWVLIDQSGKKVVIGDIQRGNQTVEVITDHLSSGLYFFQLYNNEHVWDSQRVMIMKGSR